ncbi:MAG TPA: protein kinase [Blastocatellia bacterium]|nr:protein kinase [Blastocatellia bacterium]
MIGKVIGNYQITSELARGGMGTVYRARHVNLPREVVVKSILLGGYEPHTQEHLKARFWREAYVQSQLDHPGIVRVYEFFAAEENYYLVMEYVAGLSLRDLLERQKALRPVQTLQLFKQALAAMDYAHSFSYVDEKGNSHTGIVHRDIKPANLLIDGQGRVKITDFGIVKVAGEKAMTQIGFNPGTVEYMSPEQIRGHEIDVRSDIYSLGVTLYEMLAGRLPFEPSETGSDYEVKKGHIELTPPPITDFRPDVPGELAAIVMRALDKDPGGRFQTAGEFLAAINAYERHAETESSPPPNPMAGITQRVSAAATVAAHAEMPVADKMAGVPAPHQPTVVADNVSTSKADKTGLRVLVIGAVAVIVLALLAGVYFLLNRGGAEQSARADTSVTDSTPAPTPAPSIQSQPAEEDAGLKQARAWEESENYREAIALYESYRNKHPDAPDAQATFERSQSLKKLTGLLASADLAMKQQDYAAAQRDYEEALRLRPDSKLAKLGAEEARKKLAGKR